MTANLKVSVSKNELQNNWHGLRSLGLLLGRMG